MQEWSESCPSGERAERELDEAFKPKARLWAYLLIVCRISPGSCLILLHSQTELDKMMEKMQAMIVALIVSRCADHV